MAFLTPKFPACATRQDFIFCPKTKQRGLIISSAFVLPSKKHILTVAHAFVDERGHMRRESLADCWFQNQQPNYQRIKLDFSGNRYRLHRNYRQPGGFDYAIIPLARPIVGEPFDVKAEGFWGNLGIPDIIVVSALMSDLDSFAVSGGEPNFPEPIVQACRAPERRNRRENEAATIWLTDCDIKDGASGSANLVRSPDGNLYIVGLTYGAGSNRKDFQPFSYDEGSFSLTILISGMIARDLVEMGVITSPCLSNSTSCLFLPPPR